jgi:hypothetical protein
MSVELLSVRSGSLGKSQPLPSRRLKPRAGGFQKINHPISILAKVILSLSKDDFCGSGTGKPAQNHPSTSSG